MGDFGTVEEFVRRNHSKYEKAEEVFHQESERLRRCEKEKADTESAKEIIQLVSQAVQQKVHKRIAELVSRCLAAVYEDPYEFVIHFERKKNKTEARAVFVHKDGHELDPTEGVGGGILEVACFALRVVCLSMTRPLPRKVLICDEPFKNVHGTKNRERLAGLILTLSREFGIQIILSTGLSWLEIGKVVDLSSARTRPSVHTE